MSKLPYLIALSAALFFACLLVPQPPRASAAEPTAVLVPNTGWRLLLDDKAAWRNDTLYLPDEVHLGAMPVNAPTGGWSALSGTAGISVSLPGTVEEHYWGKAPARALDPKNPGDVVNGDGSYRGVSWWYRTFTPPALAPGEHLVFAFPGARLRAEVYVNGKLCGYDTVTETPFTADVTAALKPRRPNTLAVRITNPGGNFAWEDYNSFSWGKYSIPESHGFGGLDGGVTMRIEGPAAVTDLAVLNHPDPRTVTLQAEITSTGPAYDGPVALNIAGPGGKSIWSGSALAHVPAGGKATVTDTVTIPSAKLWDIGQPTLYHASAAISAIPHSDCEQTFGFRWFGVRGLGKNATLTLNGRRIVVKSSISWGYWSPNGMFPDAAAAEREVAAVKRIGLNAIQNHRHMPKPVVLNAFDRAGLLRYCEAGAGCFTYADPPANLPTSGPVNTSGQGGHPTTFANRYELAKVLAMIRANRSHPSAIIWSLQNEVSASHYNPKIYYTLRKMREADPSRIVMLESGFSTQDQVWALPYSRDLLVDHGQGAGWNDTHSAGDSRGVYEDQYYKSATDFKYKTDDTAEVRVYGEMATGASPDDHGVMAGWYKKHGVSGYDQAMHSVDDAAYERFISRFGFRSAFPTADVLFRDAADMHYLMDARMMENARMCDAVDYIVLSGWESTTIDNHSGMVDALRFPKTDPAPVQAASAPAALVVRALHYVLDRATPASIDVHLLNENGRVPPGSYTLTVTARQGHAGPFFTTRSSVRVLGGDTFAQDLTNGITFTPRQGGDVTVTATLSPSGKKSVLSAVDHLFVVDTHPAPLKGTVAVVGSPQLAGAIRSQFGVQVAPYASAPADARTIVVGAVLAKSGAPAGSWSSSTSDRGAVSGAPDPGLYTQQKYGPAGPLARYDGLTDGHATVTLYFVEPYWDAPDKRRFDVALNGTTVLHDFDIFQAAGGKGIGITRTLGIDVTGGALTMTIPSVQKDNAIIAALQITDSAGKAVRVVFGGNDYTQADGHLWASSEKAQFDWNEVPSDALARVHDGGARLVFLSSAGDASDVRSVAEGLAKQSILHFSGMIGDPGPSWLGAWYFARKNWLLSGLPTDTVLDWQYQITGGNGIDIDAPGIEGMIGYGVNHDPHVGLGAAVIPYGKGQIVLFCIPGLAQSFVDGQPEGIDPITARRIVYNCLAGPDK